MRGPWIEGGTLKSICLLWLRLPLPLPLPLPLLLLLQSTSAVDAL